MNTTGKEISKLLRKANNFREKHETVCSEILTKLNEIADYGDLDVSVHFTNSDGYVLDFKDTTLYNEVHNTPVESILEFYKKFKRKITTEELLTIT